jgi:NADH-quinone oxidoreductase subunit C
VPLSTQTLDDISAELKALLGERALDISENHGLLIVRIPPERRAETLAMLKTYGCIYYSFCCGVDWPEQDKMEVFDHVEDLHRNLHVTVKCEVPRSNPRVETATSVYRGADWHERETWELFGIVFVGHPQLRRLLLADWQEGFPMRKDEVLRARVEKPWPGEFFSG